MALFDDRLAQEITTLVKQRYIDLGMALGATNERENLTGKESPLQQDLAYLIGIANGGYDRSTEAISRAELALTRLLELLLGNVLHSRATIPEGFWRTDIGILVSRVRWWISVDDLITISNAAALAFGENTQATRMRIVRAIENGMLEWVPDPSIANSQRNKRVLRAQVERLRELRTLPE
ncbi:hypothetical protein [Ktedonospora formicarum]|uniref:Uncharacterized protein n=1 Tax=Ktedonospora formicarum TaxID=2778364 RepID=A0A8J3I7G6_9CHLR|nr:hypothetical protein [Ktedonospora formicarum]GHO46819.1 hypothetical protein KSX_49820 [Ktedonospora formicarum]